MAFRTFVCSRRDGVEVGHFSASCLGIDGWNSSVVVGIESFRRRWPGWLSELRRFRRRSIARGRRIVVLRIPVVVLSGVVVLVTVVGVVVPSQIVPSSRAIAIRSFVRDRTRAVLVDIWWSTTWRFISRRASR